MATVCCTYYALVSEGMSGCFMLCSMQVSNGKQSYSREEVAEHASASSAWVALHGKVRWYSMTAGWAAHHPCCAVYCHATPFASTPSCQPTAMPNQMPVSVLMAALLAAERRYMT